ncbi:uncharacterized protein LOC109711114 isoform X1 [Ananas comosus]|uniref:Uncharacterized protein LOC109711114 isoform X1 n=1 Tax=Ananas comosus TaxID=4615 RepID=A0A6P5F1T0_ANACO|nr:uncharacterized protein LOC109711114 isoform X1 [Ananas comosus]
MKLRSGSKIDGNVGGGGRGGSSKEEISPNPEQSVSALNSADMRKMKEQLDVIIGLVKDRLAKDCEMKEQLDVIIGLVKDWLAKDQEKRLSVIEQQAKGREAFKNRVKLIQMMKEWNLEFVGTCDPMKAEDWIMGMEKHFSLFGTTDEDKVTIAAFMLNDGAHYWWESVESSHRETAGPITWETFKNAFYDRYSPWSLRLQKEREFRDLKQGDRSVAEYELEFSRLARFAPQRVMNEYSRASRFLQGLRPEIRFRVYALNPKTLLEASRKALLVESAYIECEQEEEVQASNKQKNRKRGRYNNSHFGGWQNNRTPQM